MAVQGSKRRGSLKDSKIVDGKAFFYLQNNSKMFLNVSFLLLISSLAGKTHKNTQGVICKCS
jgi:hypothetical protein